MLAPAASSITPHDDERRAGETEHREVNSRARKSTKMEEKEKKKTLGRKRRDRKVKKKKKFSYFCFHTGSEEFGHLKPRQETRKEKSVPLCCPCSVSGFCIF